MGNKKTVDLLEDFFKEFRKKGTRALAYCEQENSRLLLLEILEMGAHSELTLRQSLIAELEEAKEDIILSYEDEIDEKDLQESGPIAKAIDIQKEK